MIEVIKPLEDKDAQEALLPHLSAWYDEVRALLPSIPETIKIYFDNSFLIPETGEGGFTFSPEILTLSFDTSFADKVAQLKSLRSTIFHESFHLSQKYNSQESGAYAALDVALYEGCASVFERDYTHPVIFPGDYEHTPIESLVLWYEALKKIPIGKYDGEVWRNWAFSDPETGERWRMYRVGTWLIDRLLKNTSLTILDLQHSTAETIAGQLEDMRYSAF